MKKYFLLITFFVLLFLWLGNYSFAVTCEECKSSCLNNAACLDQCNKNYCPVSTTTSTSDICTESNPDACNDQTPNPTTSTTSTSTSDSTSDRDACVLDCMNKWDELAADGTDDEKVQNYVNTCMDSCSSEASCLLANSELKNDKNAVVSIPGVSCKCKPWYGESNTNTTPNICQPCSTPGVCCGIKLNTNVPFIGDCIEDKADDPSWVSSDQAFPVLMWSLVKILVTVILILSFVLIVVWGIMISTGDAAWGKKMIIKVVIWIAILWASGVILRLINPNFFG